MRAYLLFAALLGLVACSKAPEPTPPPPAPDKPGASLPDDNVFKPMVQSIDRAKGVEQTVDDAKQRIDQTLDDQQ